MIELNAAINSYKEDIVRNLQELIKIESIKGKPLPGMPCGIGPYKALEYVLDLSKSMGFEVKNYDGYVGYAELGAAGDTVGVLVHVDVVPAGEEWSYPPFSGEIHDGKLYGRGAIDDKGPVIAILYALKALRESKVSLDKKIRVVFGTDEESGFDGIDYYLKKEKPFDIGFAPDAGFPLIIGEKGILLCKFSKEINTRQDRDFQIRTIKGGAAPNMVPATCTAIVEVKRGNASFVEAAAAEFKQRYGYEIEVTTKHNSIMLNSKGITAHASFPEEGLNAISIMLLFLSELNMMGNSIAEAMNFLNTRFGIEGSNKMQKSYVDELSGGLTQNIGIINFDEGKLEFFMDIRYPISYAEDDIINAIDSEFNGMQIEKQKLFAVAPIYFSEEHKLVQTLIQVYRSVTKDYDNKPLVVGGATYARAMKNTIAFGPVFPGQVELAHQKDEYISIEHLIEITKIYANALLELAK